ncbi:hypothetical protein Tco_0895842 [Tanacetum coccineum]|uniref:Uncharacterized protein n=1 Tax=Tanacetum coccineum TaxID=301880 RepID=A0ABQ5CFS3_9ASTR
MRWRERIEESLEWLGRASERSRFSSSSLITGRDLRGRFQAGAKDFAVKILYKSLAGEIEIKAGILHLD